MPYPFEFLDPHCPFLVAQVFGMLYVEIIPQLGIVFPESVPVGDLSGGQSFFISASLISMICAMTDEAPRNFESSVLMLSSPPSQQSFRMTSLTFRGLLFEAWDA